MQITQLVANELRLTNWQELESFATINGVTVVEIRAAQGMFRVHLVRDAQSLNVSLEEGSKLAAYYNSLFWHELTSSQKLAIPLAKFLTSFQVSDSNIKHSIFITSFNPGRPKTHLTLSQLEQVATELAKIHVINSKSIKNEFDTSVAENYANLRVYRRQIRKDLYVVLELAVTNDLSKYFSNPDRVVEKVNLLIRHIHSNDHQDNDAPKVITNGKLVAESIRFDQNENITEICDWENVHLGNPAEDLANLIISSASNEIRRKKFMKVFHQYFYTLVDIRPPKYQLTDLKRWFREFHPTAVVDGIERLLLTLSESDDEQLKIDSAHRWESALDDAVDFITGNYMSDDEHVFFSQK